MSRQAMLMVGGWAHNDASLNAVASRLAPAYDVRALSTAELGTSSGDEPDAAPGGMSVYARSLYRQIGALDQRCVLVAWSMGAIIALELVSSTDCPVERLVAISATARFCSCPGYDCAVPEKNVRAMSVGLKHDPEQTLSRFISDVAHPGRLSRMALELRVAAALKIGVRELQDGLGYLRSIDLRDKLDGVGIPVLAMHGSEDRIVPPAAGEHLCHGLPHGSLEIYDGFGHNLVIDHADALAEEIEKFVEAGA